MGALIDRCQVHWQQINLAAFDCPNIWLVSLSEPVPGLAGNKIAKLDAAFDALKAGQYQGIATLGGAFSNHLLATAVACGLLGKPSLGLVRGQELDANNPSLQACRQQGMQLIGLNRSQYAERHNAAFIVHWQQQYPEYLWLPEGGSNEQGVAGVRLLDFHCSPAGPISHLVCAVGSGGTLAGLALGHPNIQLWGMSVVKDASLSRKIQVLALGQGNWQLMDAADKGYGRFKPEIWQFCQKLAEQGCQLEPIYTGKALYALVQQLRTSPLPNNARLAFFHSGGLQGLAGLRYRGLI